MKAFRYTLILFASILFGLFTFQGCDPDDKSFCDCNDQKKVRSFCGTVSDSEGKPIVDALVEVGGESTTTDKRGRFGIRVEPAERFVLNVTKLGFGFVSKIYTDTICNVSIAMSTATVEEFVPEEDAPDEVIVIEDETPPSSAPLSSNIGNVSSPLDTIPFVYDANGRLIGFRAPSSVAETYAAAEQFEQPQEGAVVEVAADALVEAPETETAGMLIQNRGRKGTISGSISTVDIYSPDGMPGDYTVRFTDGSRGYMETFGAADVNFYRDGKPLQLKEGQYATLTIPVDTIALMYFGKKLPETIPLFVYDKMKGEWVRDKDKWNNGKENNGILNKERTAYFARVSHFSVFNMDEEFNSPACYKICTPSTLPAGASGAKMEVSVPGHVKPFYPFTTSCADAACGAGGYLHAVVKMAANTPMGIRVSDNAGVIKSTYVVFAGNASAPSVPPCPYANCSGPGQIIWWTDAANRPSYMSPADDGTMIEPLIAVQKEGTVNIKVSWAFINGAPPAYTNPLNDYFIEWSTTSDDFSTANPDGTIALSISHQSANWHDVLDIPITASNFPDVNPLTGYIFRVRVGPISTAPPTVYSEPSSEIMPW